MGKVIDFREPGGGSGLPSHSTTADKGKVLTIDQISGNPAWRPSTGGEALFTGSAAIDVGGVKAGDSWENKQMSEVINDIINPELFPALTNPSFTFTSASAGLKEIGSKLNVSLVATFNRGSINPKYDSADAFRSGLPSLYTYTGPSLNETIESTALNNTKTITDYTVAYGNNTFTCSVAYSAGTQPKSSKGNNFNTPLPAGTLASKSITITGVYPVLYGIGTTVKAPLQAHGTTITVDAPADLNVAGDRFVIQYPTIWSGNTPAIQQENDLSKAWDNQNMSEYQITDLTISGIAYKQVKYIGSGIGARKLRLVF